jgi:hypothetical protein
MLKTVTYPLDLNFQHFGPNEVNRTLSNAISLSLQTKVHLSITFILRTVTGEKKKWNTVSAVKILYHCKDIFFNDSIVASGAARKRESFNKGHTTQTVLKTRSKHYSTEINWHNKNNFPKVDTMYLLHATLSSHRFLNCSLILSWPEKKGSKLGIQDFMRRAERKFLQFVWLYSDSGINSVTSGRSCGAGRGK